MRVGEKKKKEKEKKEIKGQRVNDSHVWANGTEHQYVVTGITYWYSTEYGYSKQLVNPRSGGDSPGISIRITEMRQTGTLVLGCLAGQLGERERGYWQLQWAVAVVAAAAVGKRRRYLATAYLSICRYLRFLPTYLLRAPIVI